MLITTQGIDLKNDMLLGMNQAKATGKSTLISVVNKIDDIDPLTFFAAGHKTLLGERFFWKEASVDNFYVGLGICEIITTNNSSNRFQEVEQDWRTFIDNGIVINPYEAIGVGPLLFGGFSFDQYKQKTKLWEKFSDSIFHVPKFLLSKVDGQTFLTINMVCSKDDNESLVNKVLNQIDQILSSVKENNRFPQPRLKHEKEINPKQWKRTVSNAVDYLKTASTLKKVVLARELRLFFEDTVEVESVLPHLLSEQADSFVFAFESNGDCFVGATPERLIRKKGKDVYTACVAGSIARGETEMEDEHLGAMLLADEKNLIEHQYVVDMISEAMAETCKEIIIPDTPRLLKIRDIQHLHTPVVGKCFEDTSLFTLIHRLHPTPALGGLPKNEAVEKIREIEELDRGLYAGPIGWTDYRENGEFAVAIRSALLQGNEASLFAGCGIVVDSNVETEYNETNIKFRPMLTALGGN